MSFLGDLFGTNAKLAPEQQAYQFSTDELENLRKQQLANMGQMQNVSNMFQQQAQGQGPSVAQAQLQNAMSQNAANANAIAAGARGINPGLALRQALQSNQQANQQAAGQAAVGRQQEQLMGQQGLLQAQNALAGQTNTGLGQGLQSQQARAQLNASLAAGNAGNQKDIVGGILGGAGSALSMLASGGEVPHYDDGGAVGAIMGPSSNAGQLLKLGLSNGSSKSMQEGMSALGKGLGKAGKSAMAGSSDVPGFSMPELGAQFNQQPAPNLGVLPQAPNPNAPSLGVNTNLGPTPTFNFDKGGKVPALVSPGERYLPPKEVEKVAKGEKSPVKAGEKIPGKAKVKGDSLKNDIVPKKLEEGGIVIPRSIMQSKDAPKKAAEFVAAILQKQSLKRGK